MIGVIPAAGAGQRIQPLGCSKELLPVGSQVLDGVERPKAVSEYLIERMIAAGVTEICMLISADKCDLVKYYAERDYPVEIFYVVQRRPAGLCDALFHAETFARHHDQVLIGLPDTIWFPANSYNVALRDEADEVNLILFPVNNPSVFDSVTCDDGGRVREVEVKTRKPKSHWVWGAITTTGEAFHALRQLWESRNRQDEYLGTLLNAYIRDGHTVRGHHIGETYMDVGTLDGYRRALDFLRNPATDRSPWLRVAS